MEDILLQPLVWVVEEHLGRTVLRSKSPFSDARISVFINDKTGRLNICLLDNLNQLSDHDKINFTSIDAAKDCAQILAQDNFHYFIKNKCKVKNKPVVQVVKFNNNGDIYDYLKNSYGFYCCNEMSIPKSFDTTTQWKYVTHLNGLYFYEDNLNLKELKISDNDNKIHYNIPPESLFKMLDNSNKLDAFLEDYGFVKNV